VISDCAEHSRDLLHRVQCSKHLAKRRVVYGAIRPEGGTPRREENDDWTTVLLRHDSGRTIGLLQHRRNDGEPFSEFRTGLDHVEFEVASSEELDAWRARLNDLGINHSGAFAHVVTFRDPDNIQLEFFWPGGMQPARSE
jgi:catechol 2,3-dioxygenase-like lactoylglutathione lyase family enzyme